MILRTAGNVKYFISSVFLCLGFGAFGQNPNINRADNWYFGLFAGIKFIGPNPVSVSDGQIYTGEGCTSMSDTAGNLLFYTDGVTVWNKLHQPMDPSGIQLNGSGNTNNAAVSFPHPQNPNAYYILSNFAEESPVKWSLIDMTENAGLGKILDANKPLLENVNESLVVTENCEKTNYFSFSVRAKDGLFYVIEGNPDSINLRVTSFSCPFTVNPNDIGTQGTIKVSPNGNFLIQTRAKEGGRFYLLNDFTKELYYVGSITNNIASYAAEFSQQSSVLFLTSANNEIIRTELSNQNILNRNFPVVQEGDGTDVLLAKDGKVYTGYYTFLNSFQSPDNFVSPSFNQNTVTLTGTSALKLPSFPSSWFSKDKYRVCYSGSCPEDVYTFFVSGEETPDSVVWHFGDVLNTSQVSISGSANHTYQSPGIYVVNAEIWKGGTRDSLTKYVFARENILSPGVIFDTIICEFTDLVYLPIPDQHKFACPTYGPGISPGAVVSSPGTYYIEWSNGCSNLVTDTFHVKCPDAKLPDMPNIITPNFDQTNDVIQIDMTGFIELRVKVYNRWGSEIKSTTYENPTGQFLPIYFWDGTCNNYPCSDGVYFYVAEYTTLSGSLLTDKGTITVVR